MTPTHPPLRLSLYEIEALLLALGNGGSIPEDRPDMLAAFIRAKRALRKAALKVDEEDQFP
jgi:hypothetical protein